MQACILSAVNVARRAGGMHAACPEPV